MFQIFQTLLHLPEPFNTKLSLLIPVNFLVDTFNDQIFNLENILEAKMVNKFINKPSLVKTCIIINLFKNKEEEIIFIHKSINHYKMELYDKP